MDYSAMLKTCEALYPNLNKEQLERLREGFEAQIKKIDKQLNTIDV